MDVAASGVNFIDAYERAGAYPKETPFLAVITVTDTSQYSNDISARMLTRYVSEVLNTEVKGIVEAAVNDSLGTYFEENPTVARKIIGKAINDTDLKNVEAFAERSGKRFRFARTFLGDTMSTCIDFREEVDSDDALEIEVAEIVFVEDPGHAEIRDLSLTDPLTGLPNRRHMEMVLAKEFDRAFCLRDQGVDAGCGAVEVGDRSLVVAGLAAALAVVAALT